MMRSLTLSLSLWIVFPSLGWAEGTDSCTKEHAAMGHCTPKQNAAIETESRPKSGTDLPAGNAPAPEAPEVNYADRIWGKEAMTPVRSLMYHEHGGMFASKFFAEIAAVQDNSGVDGYQWEGEAWLGYDLNRLVLKSEGEGYADKSEGESESEIQVLYSRAIGPYFNLQGGLRLDLESDESKTLAVFGLEGLAPHWFEIETMLFVDEEGEIYGRFGGSYDQLVTQKLVAEAGLEANASLQESKDKSTGAGLVDAEISLRLRYEIEREFAPFVGVSWERAFGETARILRDASEDLDSTHVQLGLRLWI